MTKLFKKIRNMAGRFNKRMDDYQEAITFAEAGQAQHSRGVLHVDAKEEQVGKLLVLGHESTFSKEVIDYALEMAQRMSYEILALNTAPLSCDTFKKFSASQKELCRNFQALAQENVKEFRSIAENQGISFQHVVKFTEREEALEEINREFKDIEFVVSDTEKANNSNRAEEQGERVSQPIYVYSMI